MKIKTKDLLSSKWVTWIVFLIGIIFLSIGIWREEYTIVMKKAINICLECIGIG